MHPSAPLGAQFPRGSSALLWAGASALGGRLAWHPPAPRTWARAAPRQEAPGPLLILARAWLSRFLVISNVDR